jgi:NADP-dependent 3-hydroxy acid dehydrogenase YdfG
MGTFDWKSQVVVVTGASAGIGACLVHEVARRGATVVLAARRADKLEEVARAAGGTHLTVAADVTRRADVERIAASAIERLGHVDVWVSNAARGLTRPVLDLTDDDVDAMVRDNVKSVLYGMQAIVPHFKERKQGHVINVSSLIGRLPFAPIRSAYCAAKAAMGMLTDLVRVELAKDFPEVRVTTFFPGVVATDFGLNAMHGGPDNRTLPFAQRPEEVAAILADAIEQRKGGDVYTRPGALDQILGHFRGLAGES